MLFLLKEHAQLTTTFCEISGHSLALLSELGRAHLSMIVIFTSVTLNIVLTSYRESRSFLLKILIQMRPLSIDRAI